MKVLGIDEAGRGCVIGPLVVAGVLVSEERLEVLSQRGVRDSKALTRARREALLPDVEEVAERVFVVQIGARELVESLTQIELRAMAQIIRDSVAHTVILDLPVGPGAQASFSRALRRATAHRRFELIAENKADALYPIVSAASVVAKVLRDRAVEELRQQYGDFGWGYPSEPKTRAFLQEWYKRTGTFPECARVKWRTLRQLSHTDDLQLDL